VTALVRGVYKRLQGFGEGAARGCGLLAAAAVALGAGGCSLSYPIASLVPEDPPATSSVAPKPVSPLSPELGAEDWRRARGALGVALDPQGSGAAVSWENPDTAMKGRFTPVGQAFVKSDEICRAFLALVEGQETTASLQGTACRPSGGEWAIREVKPFRKAG
jgi:hypothetical protein